MPQHTGPELAAEPHTPDAKKLAIGASISRRRFMWVMKRGPLMLKTKSSGVSSNHRPQLAGAAANRTSLDLDRRQLARGVRQLGALAQITAVRTRPRHGR
jgi:hypothetical protein